MTADREELRLELKPCPFCGSHNLNLANTGSCWVSCLEPHCGCEGPVSRTEDAAAHAWNTRVALHEGERKPSVVTDEMITAAIDAAWPGSDVVYCDKFDSAESMMRAAIEAALTLRFPPVCVSAEDLAAFMCGVDGNGFLCDCSPTLREAYGIRSREILRKFDLTLRVLPAAPDTEGR